MQQRQKTCKGISNSIRPVQAPRVTYRGGSAKQQCIQPFINIDYWFRRSMHDSMVAPTPSRIFLRAGQILLRHCIVFVLYANCFCHSALCRLRRPLEEEAERSCHIKAGLGSKAGLYLRMVSVSSSHSLQSGILQHS